MKEVTRLFDFPHHQLQNRPLQRAFTTKYNGKWESVSTREFIDLANQMSFGLLELGVKKGDKIAVISDRNRTEWNILDIALLQIGAVSVPIYPTLTESDYQYILNHCQARFCFSSVGEIADKLNSIIGETAVENTVYFDDSEGEVCWKTLMKWGQKTTITDQLDDYRKSIGEDELATFIYTSGTMGKPKGVMLSHRNIVSDVKNSAPHVPFHAGTEVALSFLPTCHVFERTLLYLYLNYSVSIYFAESVDAIGDNLKEVRPTMMTAVPRVIEKTFEKIWAKGQNLPPYKRRLFNWAVKLGEDYEFYGKNSPAYKLKLKLARRLVFSQWKDGLGGNLNIIVSGSAALQTRLIRIFAAADILILEGYGLSETSPIVSVNTPENHNLRFNSVGKPFKNQQVAIADDGEILVRGENVMMGYYRDEEKTRAAMTDDGYLKTGDMGKLDNDGFLYITDRKKKIFKTSGGKYIVPNVLENALKKCAFIQQVVVIGEGEKMPGAIIQPNFDSLDKWVRKQGDISAKTREELLAHEKVQELFQREIKAQQKLFGKWEQIKKFELTPEVWSIDNNQLTPTLKVKRHVILKQYAHLYDKIYPPHQSKQSAKSKLKNK